VNKSWYKLLVSLVLVALLVAPTGPTVQAGKGEPPGSRCACCSHAGTRQQSARILPSDPLVRELRNTEDAKEVQHNFGALEWGDVTLITSEGSEWQVLVVPIKGNTDKAQVLLAGTRDGKQFIVLAFGVNPDGKSTNDSKGFTGSLNFYKPTGELAITATFVEGKLQDAKKLAELHNSPGLNWDCFIECLAFLELELLPVCVPSCLACAAVPMPENPLCWACAACIGGPAFFCILSCWE